MTLTASPQDQLRLLQLQQLDSALDRAKATMAQLRADPEYRQLKLSAQEAEQQAELAQDELKAAQRALATAETTVEKTQQRQAQTQSRLDAGQGSPKDLEAMTHELGTLGQLMAEQEEAQLVQMELAEGAEARATVATEHLAEAQRAVTARGEAVTAQAQQVAAEGKRLTTERATLAQSLPADLVALYDKIRSRNAGLGAARLEGNRSEASGLPIPPRELEKIMSLAPDQIARCPETEAILVRSTQ